MATELAVFLASRGERRHHRPRSSARYGTNGRTGPSISTSCGEATSIRCAGSPAATAASTGATNERCVRLRAAIVGCGFIGQRRARAMPGARLVACADVDLPRATALANSVAGCRAFGNWRDMLSEVDCDIVVVATLHDSLAEITAAAIAAGRHVLVEKPAARFAAELEPVLAAAAAEGRVGPGRLQPPLPSRRCARRASWSMPARSAS